MTETRFSKQQQKIARMTADFIAYESGSYVPNKQQKTHGDDSPSRQVTSAALWALSNFGLTDSLKNPLLHSDLCVCSERPPLGTSTPNEPFQLKPNAHSVLYKQRWLRTNTTYLVLHRTQSCRWLDMCRSTKSGFVATNTSHPNRSNGR